MAAVTAGYGMTEQSFAAEPAPEPEDPVLPYVTHRWSRHVVQPLLITLLVSSLFAAVAAIFAILFSTAIWLYMPVLCFFVVLEGIYTSLWLQHPNQRITDNLAYRAAELVVIVLATRIFTWVITGDFPDWHLYLDYLRHPLSLFSDLIFILGTLFIVFAWVRGLDLAITFSSLAIDRAEAAYYSTPKRERSEDQRPFRRSRSHTIRTFFKQWIWGGVFLAFCVALSTFDLPQLRTVSNPFAITRLGLQPLVLMAILVYFLAGFLLMSQAKLQAVNARWLQNGVVTSRRVERNWHRNSVYVLLIIAFMAALLPIGSTTGIGRILETAVFLLTGLVTLVYLLIIGLIAMLVPQSQQTDAVGPVPTLEPLPTPEILPPQTPQAPSEAAAFIFSSAFWALAIVLSVVAVSFFLRERGVRLNLTVLKQIGHQLLAWLKQAWQGVSRQAGELSRTVYARLNMEPEKEEGEGEKRPFRFMRLNALSPREQIRYFYLSTVRRAGEKGIKRRQDETPLEYAQDLKEEFPDTEIDVEALTDAFLKAQYSPQLIEKEEVNPIKRRWKHMRSNLRRRRKRKNDSG